MEFTWFKAREGGLWAYGPGTSPSPEEGEAMGLTAVSAQEVQAIRAQEAQEAAMAALADDGQPDYMALVDEGDAA